MCEDVRACVCVCVCMCVCGHDIQPDVMCCFLPSNIQNRITDKMQQTADSR
jgi:hypothetical protein